MRLFVAVDVPASLKDAIETDVVGRLRDHVPGARWTRPEGRHLTLKFLGNVPEERVGEIGEALATAAGRGKPFSTSFVELGGFPNLRRPRVLWVRLGDGAETMAMIAADVERELQPLGFEPEGRPFRGHLTLARFPRPRVIADVPETTVPSEPFDVSDIVLFQSQLNPKGARYTPLERFALEG